MNKYEERAMCLIFTMIAADLAKNIKTLKDRYNNSEKTYNKTKELPKDFFDDEVEMTEELFLAIFGKGAMSVLAQLYVLTRLFKFSTSRDYISEIVIASTSKNMTETYGNVSNARNVIHEAIRANLIKVANAKYRFEQDKNKKGKAKTYGWNKKTQDFIVSMYKKYCENETVKKKVNLYRENYESSFTFHKEMFEEVANLEDALNKVAGFTFKISSKLHLPSYLTDDEIMLLLFHYYPQIEFFSNMVDEMNKYLDPENKIRFIPNIHRSNGDKIVTKIGLRATCNIASLNVRGEKSKRIMREEYLKTRFPQGYGSYDVKSSIYRIAHLYSTGEWVNPDVDLYQSMFSNVVKLKGVNRENFKGLSMRNYFDKPYATFNHVKPAIERSIDAYGEELVKEAFDEMNKRQRVVTGESLDSEIFLHESCIYILVAYILRKEKGLDVVQVYDGFYWGLKDDVEVTKEYMDNLVEESAYWYYENFIAKGAENE